MPCGSSIIPSTWKYWLGSSEFRMMPAAVSDDSAWSFSAVASAAVGARAFVGTGAATAVLAYRQQAFLIRLPWVCMAQAL